MSRGWFKKTGRNIDVQVEEINAIAPAQVSIDAILEFVRTYKPNSYKSPALLIREQLEDRFKELTGFRIKDYYVDHLLRSAYFSRPATEAEAVPF
ncbi:hypothetical protein [Larkinella terrae]|uniref:Uncharacterized protein n=1 Tax=Larkinella terrae TaxID=2025311 RepID=A0A7K0EKA9_9BACT|nr:hypothetical protein [Larkinella terrae]MRS61898.1 hypothetical protein [Larkinella terrae]